ncbi:MAG TPA: hypothetical protein VHW09_28280 [Bryobacteraceae bacterium]|jgi:hypothetical protein|nr:hypothetical protein [Bryobacteraceae bacterium]
MLNFRTFFAILFMSAMASAQVCNPHPFRPDGREPCATIADLGVQALNAAADFNAKTADLNRVVEQARQRYWVLYPSAPGVDAAEKAFVGALETKDLFYAMFTLQQGMGGDVTKMANAIAVTGGDRSITSLDKFPTMVDGGIRPYAFPLFAAWINALRRSEGREHDGDWANPMLVGVAARDQSNWHKAYADARNWAELLSSGRDLSRYLTPEVYMQKQMEADVCAALGQAKPNDLPDPSGAAVELYKEFVKIFGAKEVAAAADTTLHAPKNSAGGLATRADVEIGSYVRSPSPNPYFLFLTKATRGSARAYAVALAFDPNTLMSSGPTVAFNSGAPWEKAHLVYTQLVARYGEASVLAAAERLRLAPKNAQGAIEGDPQAQPLRYWFQTLLSNPKATVPDGQVPHFRASSYDPRWVGKTVEVHGTVSRVAVDTSGSPLYATIYFRESSNRGIMGFTPYSDMLQDTYGKDFAGLVGKPVKLVGEVTSWREGGGVRILDPKQVKVLDGAAAGADFHESRPDWLSGTAAPAVSNLVDSPRYLGWKKFPPGTKAVLETRVLSETQPGANLYTRTPISRITMHLDSIDEQHAVVTASSTIWHGNGPATQSPASELTIAAKEAPSAPRDSTWSVTDGEETVTINGKKIDTKWESIARASDPMEFTKTWRSDEVPGGLVMEHRQSHTEMGGKPFRTIAETIYAPLDGVMPVLGDKTPPAQGAAPPRAAAPVAAPQTELTKRSNDLTARVARARVGLAQRQRTGVAIPPDVSAAASRLPTQSMAARRAMGMRDDGLAATNLDTLEETLRIVEGYLAH